MPFRLMVSSSNTLKFFHCTVLVSWNSSIMMFSSWVPIFSKMKGEFWWSIMACSSACVSLSIKRLTSRLMACTLFSIPSSNRSWLRCCRVKSAVAYNKACCFRSFSVDCNSGMSCVSTKSYMGFPATALALVSQASTLFVALAAVALYTFSLSTKSPSMSFLK